MSRLSERLGAILRRGHIDEVRLNAIAEAGVSGTSAPSAGPVAPATPAELAHLRACSRCRT